MLLASGFSILSGGDSSSSILICYGEGEFMTWFRQRPLAISSSNTILAVFSSSLVDLLLTFELKSLLKLYFRPSKDSRDIFEVEKIAWVSESTTSTSAVRQMMGLYTSISSWVSSSYFSFSLILDFSISKLPGSTLWGSNASSSSKLDWFSAS